MDIRQCINCKKEFEANVPTKTFCSQDCRKKTKIEKIIKKRKESTDFSWKIEKPCEVCGKIYFPVNQQQKYCSSICRDKTHTEEYLLSQMENFGKIGNIPWLKIRIMVMDRDGFKCMYCGRNPRESETILHIDHKIPRKEGGKDEIENLITSCTECNLGKSDRLLEIWKKQK